MNTQNSGWNNKHPIEYSYYMQERVKNSGE